MQPVKPAKQDYERKDAAGNSYDLNRIHNASWLGFRSLIPAEFGN